MPLYQVTVTKTVASNGIRLEPGMQVVIPTQTTTNPVSVNGGKDVIAAFQRVYAINVTSIFGFLKTVLRVDKIG
jgi:hypothetical protein